jgi:hypothetical protein
MNVDQAGHWLHHDQFETYINATRSFLKKHNNHH